MPQKQRLSFLSAIVLPLFALAAFFVFSPAKATATSCPYGSVYEHNGCLTPGSCSTGSGECYLSGTRYGVYVFCQAGDNGVGGVQMPGEGSCNDGCVTCYDGYWGGNQPNP